MSEPDDQSSEGPSPGSPPASPRSPAEGGGSNKRKPPAWAMYFLRAPERTGQARAAAEDAGVDHTTAYARRKAHAGIAAAWAEALRAASAAKAQREADEIAAVRAGGFHVAPSPGSPLASPPSPSGGEGLVASGGQMKRAGQGRWSQAKEKIFFEELAATANARRAAKAAGESSNAVVARRMKHPGFAAKWGAAVGPRKGATELYLA